MCQISHFSLSRSLLTFTHLTHSPSYLSAPASYHTRLFDTHALTSNTAQKAAALRLRPACDHPRCLPTWYLPRESSHLPSLSQICLRSKEIHCTFESSKETVVTLFQLDVHRYIEGITGGQVVFTGGGWRRNFRLTSNDENTSESLGDPVNPPPSNVSVVGAMASQSG